VKRDLLRILCSAAALAGLAGVLYATPHGIGLSPDSLGYLGGARSLLAGAGFSAPATGRAITQHAPLYSWLLALAAFPSSDPAAAARWLSAIIFAVNILLLVLLVRAAFGDGPAWTGPLAGLLALSSAPMWHVHLMAWSEPLFIGLCLAAVWSFASHLAVSRKSRLYASAAATALAMLARYAGLSMWLALGTLLLFSKTGPMRRRLADLVGFSVVCLVPFLLLLVRNHLAGGSATNRTAAFHPVTRAQLHEGLATVSSWWMVPAAAPGWIKAAVVGAAGAACAAALVSWSRTRRESAAGHRRSGLPPAVTVSAWSAAAYGAFLLLSISIADANIPLDHRTLAPLLALLLAPCLFAWHALWTRAQRLPARALLLAAAALFVTGGWSASVPWLRESHAEGIGFNNVRWRNSDIVRALRASPAAGPIYSNAPDGIAYWTGREAKRIPARYSKMTRRPDPRFAQEMERLRRDLASGAILVYFRRIGAGSDAEVDALIRELELRPGSFHDDGIIYAR